ncbi:acid phosphatase det1 [Gryganskiella cystojenkinii]|nr:acid phosphatase det1 [Gryganskiella cystojenkinii]
MYKSAGSMSLSMPVTPEQDELMEGSDTSYLRPPRRPRESLLRSLRARELGANRAKCPVVASRRLYRSIHPNSTIHAVDCQFSNLKRFTPCGQYLIGMSKNQRSVHIYKFKGSGGPPDERSRDQLQFKDYFDLLHETMVLRESELLSKDFCLVTANGRFIIVASVSPCTGGSADGRAYPCSLNCIPNLDTIVFYVLELTTGKIIDRREFKNEYITIAHHAGVSLYDNLFAVMLTQSQAIQIIHIKNDGRLIDLHRIGWFNHDDDELVLARYRDFNEQYLARQTESSNSPFYLHGLSLKNEDYGDYRGREKHESFAVAPIVSSPSVDFIPDATYHQVPTNTNNSNNVGALRTSIVQQSFVSQVSYASRKHRDEPHSQTISGIKQRLMAYLFKKAFDADDGGAALRHFHLTFDQFAGLIMLRMQFLDETTLLIKFGKLDCVVSRADSTYQTAFFVFYDIRTTEILNVYDNASEEFLRIYEAWADQFCATAYTTAGTDKRHYSSTCSNNIFTKDHLKKTQYGMRHARNGGSAQAVKRSLCVLPYSPQSLSDSPYLDQALFSYDEKVISASDRQRPCQDFPIKFYLRGSGELRFKIHLFRPGAQGGSNNSSNNSITNGTNNNINNTNTNNNLANLATTLMANNGGTTNNNQNSGGGGGTTAVRSKKVATFIAHPREPFIISIIQQHLQPTILNFHIRVPDPEPL